MKWRFAIYRCWVWKGLGHAWREGSWLLNRYLLEELRLWSIHKHLLGLYLIVHYRMSWRNELQRLVDLLMEISFRVSKSVINMCKILWVRCLYFWERMRLLLRNLLSKLCVKLERIAWSKFLLRRLMRK